MPLYQLQCKIRTVQCRLLVLLVWLAHQWVKVVSRNNAGTILAHNNNELINWTNSSNPVIFSMKRMIDMTAGAWAALETMFHVEKSALTRPSAKAIFTEPPQAANFEFTNCTSAKAISEEAAWSPNPLKIVQDMRCASLGALACGLGVCSLTYQMHLKLGSRKRSNASPVQSSCINDPMRKVEVVEIFQNGRARKHIDDLAIYITGI